MELIVLPGVVLSLFNHLHIQVLHPQSICPGGSQEDLRLPLLLTSIINLFIPCWYSSHANSHKTIAATKQILFINTCYILVTSIPSFDFTYNILNLTMYKPLFSCFVLYEFLTFAFLCQTA